MLDQRSRARSKRSSIREPAYFVRGSLDRNRELGLDLFLNGRNAPAVAPRYDPPMLTAARLPGLFVTGTDTGVGKTVIAAAICDWFRRRNARVGVCKIAATGCEKRREGLVSPDAEYLAHWADSRHPLDVICPQRWAEPLAPAVAAERAKRPMDWSVVQSSFDILQRDSDVIVVEGVGGIRVPMDTEHTLLDAVKWLGLPALVVARPGLGTINHTLLTIDAIRSAGVPVLGVVINRYPTDTTDTATETNPKSIEKWGRTRVLCVGPDEPFDPPAMPAGVRAAVDPVDWAQLVSADEKL
jgi:dethiobiotin synthetase